MKITYKDKLIKMGEELRPDITTEAPHVWFKPPTPGAQYTLALVKGFVL